MTTNPPINFTSAELALMIKPDTLSTYEWVKQNLRIVAGPYKGKLWNPDVAPQAKGIMDKADDPDVTDIFNFASSQSTKTTTAHAIALSRISKKPTTVGIGMPGEKAAQKVFEEKIIPAVKSIKVLREMLSDSRYAIATTEVKFRTGDKLMAMWSGSEASMRTISMEIVIRDEPDTYQDAQAMPSMRERMDAYEEVGNPLCLTIGKVKGTESESRSWLEAMKRGQAWYRYEVCCPACGTPQVMDDRNIVALNGEKDPKEIVRRRLARYRCPHCEYHWTDEARNIALRRGKWKSGQMNEGRWKPCEEPVGAKVVVFHQPKWENVLTSMSTVLALWFEAQGDPTLMQNYDNNVKCVPYKVITRETSVSVVRKLITEHPPMVAPSWTWAVTVAADNQLGGLPFVARAWGKDRRSMLLQQGWVNSLEELEAVLDHQWPVDGSDGLYAPVWRACVDIGGTKLEEDRTREELGYSMTEEVKAWLQQNYWRQNLFGVKGAARPMTVSVKASSVGSAPNVSRKHQNAVGKMIIYMLDPKSLKDMVHYRLNIKSKQPMLMHAEVDHDGNPRPGLLNDYIKQLTAERLVQKNGKEMWDAGRRANHYFDCEYYNAALVDPFWTPSFQMLPEPYLIYPQPSLETSKLKKKKKSSRRSRW